MAALKLFNVVFTIKQLLQDPMKKILFAILALTALALAGVFIFVDDFNIELSETDVQTAIDQRIASGPLEHFGASLDLRAATIDFLPNNTAQLDVDFDASGFGYKGTVTGDMATGLDYRAPELFLAHLKLDDLSMTLDAQTNSKLKDVTNVAKDFLKRQREEMLTDEARESLDKLVTGENSALEQKMQAAVKWFITTIPIYDLNDAGAKGMAASLALKEVRFTEHSAIVTLSPRQAVLKIVSFIGICLMLAAFFLMQFLPEFLLRKAAALPGNEEE